MLRYALAVLLLFSALVSADALYRAEGAGQPAEYLGTDGQEILVHFQLPLLTEETEIVGEFGEGSILRIPGEGVGMPVGSPDLPVIRRMVQVPNTGGIQAEIISAEYSPLGLFSIPPRQPSPTRSGGPLPYRINEEVYSSSSFYPEQAVNVERVTILRDIRVAWVSFSPVRYNPATGETEIITEATVKLTVSGQGENELLRTAQGITRSFEPWYEEVLGYSGGGMDYLDGSYMVISTQAGLDLCQDLVDWKRQKGYDVQIALYPDDTGAGSGDIDSYIEDAYNTWPTPPEWVLIIGDHDIVPTPSYSGHAADNLYGVIGSGSVPSVHMGRITGSDTDDLAYITWKIHQYEMDPYEPATSWFQNAISIGSTDFSDPEHSWEYAQIFMADGMTVDYFCSEGGMSPTPSNVFASIEDGKSLISFIGHGSMTSWSSPSCGDISDVQGLSNGRMLPWINSIACQNGKFDAGYCFAEAWMGEGTTSDVKGAVGIMAATTNSPVGQTDSLAEYTFRGYFEDDIWRMGAAVDYGKMKVEEFYGSGADDNNNMHMIFGCPETDIFTDTSPMVHLDVDHDATISEGSWTVDVTAGGAAVEGALVGVVQDTVYLESGYTDASGSLTLNIPAIPGTEDATVTCTYHNRYPYITDVPVDGVGIGGSPQGIPSLTLSEPVPNPVSGSARFYVSLPSAGHVSLDIYDLSGRVVDNLLSEEIAAGQHTLQWNGHNSSGDPVPGGIYMVRLTTGQSTVTRSCVVIR